MLDEWNSADSYDVRIDRIRRGTNDIPPLDITNVFDDHATDVLTGGDGQDWFFTASDDKITDRNKGEVVN